MGKIQCQNLWVGAHNLDSRVNHIGVVGLDYGGKEFGILVVASVGLFGQYAVHGDQVLHSGISRSFGDSPYDVSLFIAGCADFGRGFSGIAVTLKLGRCGRNGAV